MNKNNEMKEFCSVAKMVLTIPNSIHCGNAVMKTILRIFIKKMVLWCCVSCDNFLCGGNV